MVVSVVGGGESRLFPVPGLSMACSTPSPAVASPSDRLFATWYLPQGMDTPSGTVSFR
ncbi:hypothetical protein E2C01_067204 [Portunus trituberculatus]|uniref:Uncharacterized protein n=2 Tax=Portunus trituberculatus TaxID=210409 RepID=A0A5B7HJ69_PORTR|nr:hypothetical protein [Portunus trituberculatus]